MRTKKKSPSKDWLSSELHTGIRFVPHRKHKVVFWEVIFWIWVKSSWCFWSTVFLLNAGKS